MKPKYEIGDIEKSLQRLCQQLIDSDLSQEHLQLTYRNLETLANLTQHKLRQIWSTKYMSSDD